MEGNPKERALLGRIVSPENAANWWQPALFEKNTRRLLPSDMRVLEVPPQETDNYNCFVYALGLQDTRWFLGHDGWAFTSGLHTAFDAMIRDGVLHRIPQQQAGCLVVYRTDDGSISHVGIMQDGEKVRSKWSWGPLLEHNLWQVPDHYGDTVEFFTHTREARDAVVRLSAKNTA